MKINDPRFNLREIAKQLILLEEHLLEPRKYCPDCISKHLLNIEALAEECQSLDGKQQWCDLAQSFADQSRRWGSQFIHGTPPAQIGQEVRALRKRISIEVLDSETTDLAPADFSGLSPGAFGVSNKGAWLIVGLGLAGLIWWSEKRR
jgi:hypothetical protein